MTGCLHDYICNINDIDGLKVITVCQSQYIKDKKNKDVHVLKHELYHISLST